MLFIFLTSLIFFGIKAQTCENSQILSTSNTTQNATILKHVAYISNNEAITPLTSVVQGKYEIRWTEYIKTARNGLIIVGTNAQNCENPQIVSTSYTTQDATILKHVAYISNFYVKCEAGESGNLYAWLGEGITPVASVGQGKYQISWTEDVKTAKTGNINVKVYNETGYLTLRKAIRAGEGISNVPVFTTLKITHSGVYGGPWISCELLAAVFSIGVAYIAIHFRTKLLN